MNGSNYIQVAESVAILIKSDPCEFFGRSTREKAWGKHCQSVSNLFLHSKFRLLADGLNTPLLREGSVLFLKLLLWLQHKSLSAAEAVSKVNWLIAWPYQSERSPLLRYHPILPKFKGKLQTVKAWRICDSRSPEQFPGGCINYWLLLPWKGGRLGHSGGSFLEPENGSGNGTWLPLRVLSISLELQIGSLLSKTNKLQRILPWSQHCAEQRLFIYSFIHSNICALFSFCIKPEVFLHLKSLPLTYMTLLFKENLQDGERLFRSRVNLPHCLFNYRSHFMELNF